MRQTVEWTNNIDVDLYWECWLLCYDDTVKTHVPKNYGKKKHKLLQVKHNQLIADLPDTLDETPKRLWSYLDRKQKYT